MIKNTSGLAVQPCRLHERFYYHARLLYYILRQKARGFFARGRSPCYPDMRGGWCPLCTPQCGSTAPTPSESGRSARDLCKDIVPAPTFWALRPKPRPTFSRRESRQRYARNLLVPGPPAQGGGPPWIPPASALAVLVEGVQGLRHPRGAARQMGLPIPFPLFRKKLLRARWEAQAVHSR